MGALIVQLGTGINKAKYQRWNPIQREEEDLALVSKGMNTKGKKFQGEVDSIQEGKKKDLSKIKCFNCHEFEHYDTKCSHKKERKEPKITVTDEALAS